MFSIASIALNPVSVPFCSKNFADAPGFASHGPFQTQHGNAPNFLEPSSPHSRGRASEVLPKIFALESVDSTPIGSISDTGEGTMPISPIVGDEVRNHFFSPESLKRVEAISRLGLMREHWFTAELAYLFSEMEKRESIKWEPEYPVSPGRIDFRLRLLEETVVKETVVVEVKVMPTRNKDGTPYPITRLDWAKQNCAPDVLKMLKLPANSHYFLIFAYPAPPADHWKVLVKNIEGLCQGYTVAPSGVPDDSLGGKLSIGWLEVQASTQAVGLGNSLVTSSPTSP
jgi:hypothetical protein